MNSSSSDHPHKKVNGSNLPQPQTNKSHMCLKQPATGCLFLRSFSCRRSLSRAPHLAVFCTTGGRSFTTLEVELTHIQQLQLFETYCSLVDCNHQCTRRAYHPTSYMILHVKIQMFHKHTTNSTFWQTNSSCPIPLYSPVS